jgi:hypothetical protein
MLEFIKWGGLTPDELKARQEREWAEAIMIAEARIAAQLSAVGAKGGGSQPTGLSFVVNTTEFLLFRFSFTSTNEPIEFTINWGDGTIHEDSGYGGFYPEEHEYAEEGEYTVTVTFDDPLKVLELDFPGTFYPDDETQYAGISSITGLQSLPNLQSFAADYNYLVSVDLSNLPNLTIVDISDCRIPNSEGQHSLTSVNLSGNTAIESLRLDDSDFSEGYPDISGLTGTLTLLDIDESYLSGAIDLSQFSVLTSIDLRDNDNITSIILPETPITNLNLNDNDLTQEAVDYILEWLDESGVENGYVDLEGGTNAEPGEAGSTAIENLLEKGWEVYVNSVETPPGHVGIAASTDFDIVGDFTIEMFFNLNGYGSFPRLYSFGSYPAANAISIENAAIYFWANGAFTATAPWSPNLDQWYHICVQGVGSSLYLYLDGILLDTTPYSGDISSQTLPLTIGYGNEPSSDFDGRLSNFRWTKSALYSTTGFTPPTSQLTSLEDTILLIFQGNDLGLQLVDNSGNGNNATTFGASYSSASPFAGVEGSLQMGTI